MKRILASLGAMFAMTAPVSARQVELLNFGAPSPDVVLHVGGPVARQQVAGSEADVENVLTAEFGKFGIELAGAPLHPTVSRIDVPMWMRTGKAAGASRIAWPGGNRSFDETCAPPLFRPRRDLGFRTEQRRAALYPLVSAIACEHGLPVGLFDALIAQESRYRLDALSPAGAMGLAQLMPDTARYLRVHNPWDAIDNLRGGARYLREQLDEFGRVDLALAAYNAGPGRVRARRRVPRITETIDYVSKITAAWSRLMSHETTMINAGTPAQRPGPLRQTAVLTYTSPSAPNPK